MTEQPKFNREALSAAIDSQERERREENATKRLLNQSRAHISVLENKVDLLTVLDGIEATPAQWAQPPTVSRNENKAVANLILSDLHLDEVVDPGEMRGMNAYDRDIALKRIERLGRKTIEVARDLISGVSYDGLYLWVNGDLVSGNIHEELQRTNAGRGVADTIDYWVDPLASLFSMLADFFGKVHVVSTVGNHGREYKKPPAKGAVRSSFDWLTIRTIWRCLRGDDRFTWNIPESKEVFETIYSTSFLVQHGDDFKGGDQIAGPIRPVLFGDFKAMLREVGVEGGEPYDRMIVSHFHQYNVLARATINGSLVGYNEYAKNVLRARPERPQQAFFLVTPEHGVTMNLPILCGDRKSEGW